MNSATIPTARLGHYALAWAAVAALISIGIHQRVHDGHWLSILSDARIHPIPPLIWAVEFIPALVAAITRPSRAPARAQPHR